MELARKRYVDVKKDFFVWRPMDYVCLGSAPPTPEIFRRSRGNREKESPETIDFFALRFSVRHESRAVESQERPARLTALSLSINISWDRINWFWLGEKVFQTGEGDDFFLCVSIDFNEGEKNKQLYEWCMCRRQNFN